MSNLRPPDIASNNYGIALKPLLGKEKKFKISVLPAYELGALTVVGVGAGALSVTANNAGTGALLDRPSKVLLKLEEELRSDAVVVIGVVGTDQDGGVLSGSARFAPPAYVQDQSFTFPAGTAREVVVADSRKYKTITGYVPTTVGATALNAKFASFGMPENDSYVLLGCRVQLNYTGEAREPVQIACGGDDSAFVKPGQKLKRDVTLNVKIPTLSDGGARYNGLSNLVGLAVSDKEDKLVTDNEYLIGLNIRFTHTNPEASEPSTLEGTGMFEDYAHIPAGPLS